ncbi:MAG: ABC transporter permease [Thiotrichales bacterium]
MRYLFALAARSAWNRRLTLGLVAISIALSVTLLLGIERMRTDLRAGFAQSVSGTDLVVGARTSAVQLMLYAVFRIGEATQNIRYASVESLAAHPAVAWVVPLSLGDSHRGFPVLGTDQAYFEHFRYGDRRALRFVDGRPFTDVFEAVLGAEVAERLGYRLGDRITLTHGIGLGQAAAHADKPFAVVGVLARTGSPVDRTVHVGLAAIEAIHLDWQGGAPVPGLSIPAEHVGKFDLKPKQVTAALVGLKSRAGVFALQRHVNESREEPLLAVLPGVALDQLWQVVGVGERALRAVSALVVAVGLAGLVAVIMAGLNERRRELAILRSVGARPAHVFWLLALEGLAVTLVGAVLGVILLNALTLMLAPLIESRYGLALSSVGLFASELRWLVWVIGVGWVASLLPGLRAYRLSLGDGLTPRV